MIQLTTPEGRALVNEKNVTAICEITPRQGINNTVVRTQIYNNGSNDPLNVLESYDEVLQKASFEQQFLK